METVMRMRRRSKRMPPIWNDSKSPHRVQRPLTVQNEDERTRAMTKDEYVHYSECRQASFTYRKSKRFRDWVGMSNLIDSKPIPDLIDVLGFLTFEIVATLTEEALRVKADMEKAGEDG